MKYLLIILSWLAVAHVDAGEFMHMKHLFELTSDTLRLGISDEYPPYEFADEENNLVGYNLDLAKALMEELDIPYKIIRDTYTKIEKKLLSGEIDLYFYMFKTSERKRKYLFSYTHLREKCNFIVRKESSIYTLKDLANKRILVNQSSFTRKYVQSFALNNHFISVKREVDMFQALKKKKGDALIISEQAYQYYINKLNLKDEFRVFDAMLQAKEIAIVTSKENKKLIDVVNHALYRLESDGCLAKLHKKWFYYENKNTSLARVFIVVFIIIFISFVLIYTFCRVHQQAKKNKNYTRFIESMISQIPFPVVVIDITAEKHLSKAQVIVHSKTKNKFLDEKSRFNLNYSLHNEDANSLLEELQEVINTKKEINIYRKLHFLEGKILEVLVHASVFSYHQKDYFLCYSIDRTELFQAKRHAEQVDREKRIFLENMSHEIRTPLNAILGFSQMLTEELPQEDREIYVQMILRNNHELHILVNNILELSKLDAGMIDLNIEQHNVAFVFAETLSLLNELPLSSEVNIKIDTPYLYCVLEIDKSCFVHILEQILLNAVKFTSQGEIRVGYYYDKQHKELIFYCKDTGKGICPEQLPAIFNYFTKLDTFTTGTGLGLTLCRAYAKLQDAKIGVYAQEKVGAFFWFSYSGTCDYKKNREGNLKEIEQLIACRKKGIWYQKSTAGEYRLVNGDPKRKGGYL